MKTGSIVRTIVAALLLVISIGLLIFAIVHFMHKDSGTQTAKSGSSQKIQQDTKSAPKPSASKPGPSDQKNTDTQKTDQTSDQQAQANNDSAAPQADNTDGAASTTDNNTDTAGTADTSAGGTSSDDGAQAQDLAHTGPSGMLLTFLSTMVLATLAAHAYQRTLRRS